MPGVVTDYYGHPSASTLGVSAAYTAGTGASTAAGQVITPGTLSTVAPLALNCTDEAGSFNWVTAGATAGTAVSVFFAQPYPANPRSIQVTQTDITAGAALGAGVVAPAGGLNSGFTIVTAAPAASGHTISVFYHVKP